jgi:hypothetical protein
MTEGLFPEGVFELLSPESVSPGLVFLVGEDAPSRKVLAAGGGSFAIYKGLETEGVNVLPDNLSAEGVAAAWMKIDADDGIREFGGGFEQATKFATQAAMSLGIDLSGQTGGGNS